MLCYINQLYHNLKYNIKIIKSSNLYIITLMLIITIKYYQNQEISSNLFSQHRNKIQINNNILERIMYKINKDQQLVQAYMNAKIMPQMMDKKYKGSSNKNTLRQTNANPESSHKYKQKNQKSSKKESTNTNTYIKDNKYQIYNNNSGNNYASHCQYHYNRSPQPKNANSTTPQNKRGKVDSEKVININKMNKSMNSSPNRQIQSATRQHAQYKIKSKNITKQIKNSSNNKRTNQDSQQKQKQKDKTKSNSGKKQQESKKIIDLVSMQQNRTPNETSKGKNFSSATRREKYASMKFNQMSSKKIDSDNNIWENVHISKFNESKTRSNQQNGVQCNEGEQFTLQIHRQLNAHQCSAYKQLQQYLNSKGKKMQQLQASLSQLILQQFANSNNYHNGCIQRINQHNQMANKALKSRIKQLEQQYQVMNSNSKYELQELKAQVEILNEQNNKLHKNVQCQQQTIKQITYKLKDKDSQCQMMRQQIREINRERTIERQAWEKERKYIKQQVQGVLGVVRDQIYAHQP